MRKLILGLPVFAISGALLLMAQAPVKPPSADPAASSDQDSLTFKSGVKLVQAPVTVLDARGQVVNGLNALDFKLYDNGKPQEIVEDMSSHPISLVVAIQANAGMEKILPQIRKVGTLFDNLVAGENGEVAVIAFDHRVQVLTNFTSDPDQIHAAFGKDKNGNYILKAGSWTSALNDATMEGINMLRNRPANRKRILIVISESRDQGSGLKVRDVLTAAEFANVVIYPVDVSHLVTSLTAQALPSRPNTTPPGGQYLPNGQVMTPTIERQTDDGNWVPVVKEIFIAAKAIFVPNPLEVFSRYTGGREFPFYTQKGLEQAVDNIGQELHNQYLLTYRPDDVNEAGYHTIRVEVQKPGLKVYTREGYWQAAKPE